MKITIEPTDQFVQIDQHGHVARRWIGTTEQGIRCDVFVPLLRVAQDEDQAAFSLALRELPAPKGEVIELRRLT